MISIIKKWKDKIKEHFLEVLRIKTTPNSIAIGFAIGTFISVMPTPGFNIILAFIITLIFKKISKLSLFFGMLFWSPLTSPLTYYLSYRVGDYIFSGAPIITYQVSFIRHIYLLSRNFVVGSLIVALVFAILGYIIVFVIAKLYYKFKK